MTDLDTLLAAFTISEWHTHFDGKTLARARDCVRRGNVLKYAFETRGDEGVLVGSVRGVQLKEPYECRVEYFPNLHPHFNSHCSCPVETWCKHVAALLQCAVTRPQHTAAAVPTQALATVVVGDAQAQRLDRTPSVKPTPELPKREDLRPAPIPVMTLRAMTLANGAGAVEVGCAKLAFDYDGVRLRFPPDVRHERVHHAGEWLVIRRDRGAEFAACEYLYDLGLHEAHTCEQLPQRLVNLVGEDDWLLPNKIGVGTPTQLLNLLPQIKAEGFRIEFDASFPVELLAAPSIWYAEVVEQGEPWFDLGIGIEINGERIPLLPILHRALLDRTLSMVPARNEAKGAVWMAPLDKRRRVPLPLKRVRALLKPLLEWLDGRSIKMSGSLRLSRAQSFVVEDLDNATPALRWRGSHAVHDFAKHLRVASSATTLAPLGLNTELRPYQRDGLAWLTFLSKSQLGGILADDMGLGKTVQLLAHLLAEKQSGRFDAPALIIVPTSLVLNWKTEAARFTPQLKMLILQGPERHSHFAEMANNDLIVTTYPLLPRDRDVLVEQNFSVLVLDEAQTIRNPRSQAARIVRELRAQRRIAMTGTPLENHLGELWAEFDCVLPGLLGDERRFVRNFRTPIEKHADGEAQARLNRRIAPFMLRRTKEQVLHELPAKTVITRTVELIGRQRDLYESLRLTMHDKVYSALQKHGLAQSGILVLDALLKLRQVCCDPRLVKLNTGRKVPESAKLEFLLPMIEELLAEGRRILVFSQFTEMLALIAKALDESKIRYVTLTGKTRNRATPIEQFQSGAVPLFLISLKAGGVGLNLTAADTVIHYDPWWNPAVETQATDRAHRIGQNKSVFVYKLICSGTVEEKIQVLQQRKADLAAAVLKGGTTQKVRFEEEDIETLFGTDPP